MQSLFEDMQSRSQSHAGSMAASSVCFCGQVRAHVERQIGLIAEGKAEKEAVVLHTLDQFAQKFRHFVTKIARMDALFEASFSPLASSGNLGHNSMLSCSNRMGYFSSFSCVQSTFHKSMQDETGAGAEMSASEATHGLGFIKDPSCPLIGKGGNVQARCWVNAGSVCDT